MSWANFHTHSYFCDGLENPRQYVAEALRQDVKALGFSSHAPLPLETSWHMHTQDLELYCQTIRTLQQTYAGRLPVFLGLEIDFIPGIISPQAAIFQPLRLDYTIGGVHFVGADRAGKPWGIDDDLASFDRGLAEIYGGNIRKVVESYYDLVRQMLQTTTPNLVAHLDLIKKNNPKEQYFSEAEPWYRQAVFETLQTVATTGTILEVNTGGIVRKRTDTIYPSPWILEACLGLDIPITLSSDAHTPEHITAGFAEAAFILQEIGYQELYLLGEKGWYARPFSEDGLMLDSHS